MSSCLYTKNVGKKSCLKSMGMRWCFWMQHTRPHDIYYLCFFLVVKTNVDYQIVATFVTESATFEAITEALGIIKSWNEDLQPLYCMTDYCTAEIRALETIFVDACLYKKLSLLLHYH